MNNGWDRSASSWIATMGEQGDWAENMCLIRLCSNAPRRSDSNVRST
jgi:hypothetical protein